MGSGPTQTLVLLQEVLAPFVLSNSGCSGNESRLVDCPVEASTRGSAARGTVNTQACDPAACDRFR